MFLLVLKKVWSIPADVLLLELKWPSLVQRRQRGQIVASSGQLNNYVALSLGVVQEAKSILEVTIIGNGTAANLFKNSYVVTEKNIKLLKVIITVKPLTKSLFMFSYVS